MMFDRPSKMKPVVLVYTAMTLLGLGMATSRCNAPPAPVGCLDTARRAEGTMHLSCTNPEQIGSLEMQQGLLFWLCRCSKSVASMSDPKVLDDGGSSTASSDISMSPMERSMR